MVKPISSYAVVLAGGSLISVAALNVAIWRVGLSMMGQGLLKILAGCFICYVGLKLGGFWIEFWLVNGIRRDE